MNASRIKAKGLKRLINAGGYSIAGLQDAWRTEEAFRQEIILAFILIPVSFLIDTTAVGHALLVASVLFVLLIELLNTAIETVIERISDDIHPLSKRAKDLGSAAVFVSLINVAAVWGIILLL
ncbi:MAG: diacylglycerol kinase [Micavibrio aeruginosavorus]|uniref:Diacylglycerol kinase n=1 Tax=Micavibrio aeruginosavorus TaxID=349221 RepID=A0A7T5R3S4_9BACT|nr:MAG: diacylglycerol kinase [Micavibrio aeruginosavorus]